MDIGVIEFEFESPTGPSDNVGLGKFIPYGPKMWPQLPEGCERCTTLRVLRTQVVGTPATLGPPAEFFMVTWSLAAVSKPGTREVVLLDTAFVTTSSMPGDGVVFGRLRKQYEPRLLVIERCGGFGLYSNVPGAWTLNVRIEVTPCVGPGCL